MSDLSDCREGGDGGVEGDESNEGGDESSGCAVGSGAAAVASVSSLQKLKANLRVSTPTEIRTLNLLLRRQTPYPLGHGGGTLVTSKKQYSTMHAAPSAPWSRPSPRRQGLPELKILFCVGSFFCLGTSFGVCRVPEGLLWAKFSRGAGAPAHALVGPRAEACTRLSELCLRLNW